jgi:hypothetical protein
MKYWGPRDRKEILNFANHRFTIEQLLARELLNTFEDDKPSMELLRGMVSMAIEVMLKMPTLAKTAQETERHLSVWKRFPTLESVREGVLMRSGRKLTVTECADIIRLYGEYVEQGHKDNIPKLVSENQTKSGFREFGKPVFDQKQGFRHRGQFLSPQEKIAAGVSNELVLGAGEAWKEQLVGGLGGGIQLKQAAGTDVLGKIEKVFGIPRGAAISGTTADTVHFMKKFGAAVGGLDPIYFIVPVASLVYNYHHSLVEVAMTLTLNGLMDYSIASYSTLLPKKSGTRLKPSVFSLLNRFEARIDNKFILNHYNGSTIEGCYQMEAQDKPAFRKLATTNLKLWQTFKGYGDWPSEANILGLLHMHGMMAKATKAKRGRRPAMV